MDKPPQKIPSLPFTPLEISPEEFTLIQNTLRELRDFDLDNYKDKCIKRRIAIRVRATHCATVREYCDYLLAKEAEVDLLLKVMTIHVSQFFRNAQTFVKLEQEIFPYLFSTARQEGRGELKLWSVGCSSGEEPYSLALLLAEHFPRELERLQVSIRATDVDGGVLETARRGIYGEERLGELPAAYRQRYFSCSDGKYHLRPAIKGMVSFHQADLSHGELYPESDLILCRNVLIYFERDQQERVIRSFARVLRPGGVLVLGKSETLFGESRRFFQTICPVERIYKVIS
jgi:chemotaxis protein methyltransferase CheR